MAFKSKWPRARLHVHLAHMPDWVFGAPIMDVDMFTAPQLHSLHLGFSHDDHVHDTCLLSILLDAIANSKTLKSLYILDCICPLMSVHEKRVRRIESLESYTVFGVRDEYYMGT